MGVELTRPERLRQDLERWLPAILAESGEPIGGLVVHELSRPSTGQSNETVLLDVSWRAGTADRHASYVARLQPRTNQMFLDADVLREGRLLRRLGEVSMLPVPRVEAI